MISVKNARLYCKDDITKIENYEEALNSDVMYDCHHRLELTLNNEFAHSREDLIRLGMYFKRPHFELIFLKPSEHTALHSNAMPESYRKKQGEKIRGKGNGMYGKINPRRGCKNTKEHIEKSANAIRGKKHSLERRLKNSISHLGLQCGEKNGMFGKKHSPETLEKMSKIKLGKAPGNKGKKLVIIDGKKRYV